MIPAFQQNRVTIFNADVLDCLRTLPDELVQCVVTSPPYWGLRDYGTAIWHGGDSSCDHKSNSGLQGKNGARADREHTQAVIYKATCGKCGATREDRQLGLETNPEEYLQRMVEVFREVRRVLRSDGTLWLNMGDSYMGSGHGWSVNPTDKQLTQKYWRDKKTKDKYEKPVNYISSPQTNGFKPKDLAGMPWRLALALQADGWYLRSDIIWHKPNPMPESVTDRPTKAHEYIFLLAKSERYFYDAEAIKETGADPERERSEKFGGKNGHLVRHSDGSIFEGSQTRNKRTVWTVPTEPFPEAHFATFPTELIKPCILAGTSERGACSRCGAPWQRVVEAETGPHPNRWSKVPNAGQFNKEENCYEFSGDALGMARYTRTIGWKPACACPPKPENETVPCIVLDPFMGSGTVAEVARMNGCEAYGIELNPEYVEIASRRLRQDILAFS